jgi:glycerol-3-phosphate acyltransferase PlsY
MPWLEQLRTADWILAGWLVLGAYLSGCFTTGYYLVRWRTGQDLRETGSGSVGAKNAGRVLGVPGFVLTVSGDFAKGMFAVWVARHFTQDDRLVALAMLAVVAGHVWPAQLRFRGGKGIATSLGALLIYDYHLAFAFLILFGGVFAVFRKTVLPGLFGFVCLPLVSMYLGHEPAKVVCISMLGVLVLATHRKNLQEEILHLAGRRQPNPKINKREL